MKPLLHTFWLLLLLALPGWSQDGPLKNPTPLRFAATGNAPYSPIQAPVKRNGQRPSVAAVANNVTTVVAVSAANAVIPSVQFSSANPISTITFTLTAANGANGTLYGYNPSNNTTSAAVPVGPSSLNFVTFSGLAFQPVAGFIGTYTFTYTLTNNSGEISNSATYTINVSNLSARAQTSQIILSSFGANTLSLPLVGTPDAGRTISSYRIKSLPAGGAGILSLGGAPVAVNQVISPANAGNLTFDPTSGFFGTAVFTYSAIDNTGLESNPAGYGIPVTSASCSTGTATSQRSVLDFTTRTVGEDFTTTKTITVDGVTITASPAAHPYAVSGPSTTNSFDVQDIASLPGKGLVWQEDYANNAGKNATATFTFSKPVANFTITIGDIDRNNSTGANTQYIDRLVFNGYDASGNLITLPASSVSTGPLNAYNGNNTVTATGNFSADPSNNVTVTFPQSISRLTLVYSNQTPDADAAFQFVVIPQFAWCNAAAAAAVTTSISGPASVLVGQTATYTATSTNNGGLTATNNVVTISLPDKPAVGNVTVTNGTYNPITGVVTFNAQDLGAGATATNTVSFVAQVSPSTVSGTAASTSSAFDADANDNNGTAPNATVTTTVLPIADVTSTVTSSRPAAVAGQAIGFTATYTNNGPSTAPGFTQALQLPAGLGTSNVTFSNLPTGVTAAYSNVTGAVTFTGAPTTLANGASQSVTVNIASVPSGLASLSVKSTAGTSASQGANTAPDTFTLTVPVATPTDLATTISGPTSATQGNLVTLNVTTTNLGAVAAFNVAQTVQLVSGLSSVFVSNNGTYNAINGLVTFPVLPTLSAGQTIGNYVSFAAPAAAFAPTAAVSPNTGATGDSNPANNTATLNGAMAPANIAINQPIAGAKVANLYTTIASSVLSVAPGSNVTLTVVTGNNGPSIGYNVAETVQLLPGLNTATLRINNAGFISQSGSNYLFAGGANYNTVTGLVTFAALSLLDSGASATNTIGFTVPTSANGQILPTAAVSSTSNDPGELTVDPVLADNFSATAITVTPTTDLVATITGPTAPVALNQPLTYTATFINNGPATAMNAVATVQLPVGLSEVVTSLGSYDSNTGLVTFPVQPIVLAGAGQSYTISFVPPAAGSYNASASYSSNTVEVVPANNTASTITSVTSSADLAVRLNGPASVAKGGAVTYVAETTNNGPSDAGSVTTTIQLPVGLTPATVNSSGGSYDAATGKVTFTIASLANGATVSNYANFAYPVTGVGATFVSTAVVSSTNSAITDPVAANNSASVTTNTVTTSAAQVDLSTTVTGPAAPVAPNSTVTLNVRFASTAFLTNGNPSIAIAQKLFLPPNTVVSTINGTVPSAAAYNQATGILTFAGTVFDKNNLADAYTVVLTAPATGPFSAISTISSSELETGVAQGNIINNKAVIDLIAVPTGYDEATTLTGPASALPGSAVTYTVQSVNNGPTTSGTVTQVVSLPLGTVVTNTNGGTLGSNASAVTITYTFSNQAPGVGDERANTFTATMPAAGSLSVSVATTATGETGPTANNSASMTTTAANQVPVANKLVNALQSPAGNTAGQVGITPLSATDADGTIASFRLNSIPNATDQGVLYYDNGGTYTAITPANFAALILTSAQANSLRFDPVLSFIGNAFFDYVAVDNTGNQSLPALYAIKVGQDNNSIYTTVVRGGNANQYQNGDVVAYGIDPNGAAYNADGLIYDPATNRTGTRAAGTNSGLQSAAITAANTAALTAVGIAFNPATGLFTVVDRTKLPRSGTTVPVSITTTDLFGGVNTQAFSLVLGGNPLPVELTAFEATAKNLDALLTWTTASEKSNDHFDVERSLNGTDFVKVAEVKGQGTSTSATDYARTDAGIGAKVNGLVYYRLKQVDTDGTSSYSPVRNVRFGKVVAPAIALFPNPATTATNLDLTALPAGSYQVSVLDAAGRTVLTTTLNAGLAHALQLNTIASGSYMLLVRGTNGGQVVNLAKRLIKE